MLSAQEIAIVKGMIDRGDKQHDIAAWFGVNGGRVGEVATGKVGQGIEPAPREILPPAGPVTTGRAAARARHTLEAVRDIIDIALAEIDAWESSR